MSLDTAMELSFWKEEPLSPQFSGLEEQVDLWQLIEEDVAKQGQSPERDPLGGLGNSGEWLPESPSDSCDSFIIDTSLQARGQLATQILQLLDDDIKEEPFPDWYETKTDQAIFDELPSPTPSLSKDEAASRPFAGLCMPLPMTGAPYAVAANTSYPAPAPPAAVLVPLTTVQQQQQHLQPAAALLHLPINHHTGPGLLTTVEPLTDTQTLLEEFECVFDKVERHGGALTPPQSPPHHITQHAVYYHQPVQQQVQQVHQEQPLLHFPDVLQTPQQQQQLILEVDEIVRNRVQQDEEASWLAALAPPSPCTSSNSSSSNSNSSFSCADSPAPASPETDDPEWLPDAAPGSPTPPTSADASPAPPGKAPTRKRGPAKRKPYSHNVEDKRSRKKEQNKNAATRYRMKKKAEVEEILGEENELIQKNDELQDKVKDLSQEIRYLKNLMRDVFRAKNLIK